MYKIYCDNKLMCDSSLEELALINPVVTLEENKAGSFSFTLLPQHPYYDQIKRRVSEITVFRNDEEKPIFCGICTSYKDGFYKRRAFECEGELTYLNDSIQRPTRYQNYTVRGLLEAYVNAHNNQVEEKKRFKVGAVTVKDPNDSLYRYTNMNSTLQEIKEDLVDDLGGIIRIRHKGNDRFIDYLEDGPNVNSQSIEFGENLLDFTKEIDSSDIATAIVPLGNLLDEEKIEGLQTRLTIETVNGGKDYVYSKSAVEAYGWIVKTVTFDKVTTPDALKTRGEKYLSDIQFEKMVIEATAFDMGLANEDVEKFKLSDYIRVVSKPHGMDRRFRLTKMTLNLNEPGKDKFTLGKEEIVSLSAKTNQINQLLKKTIENTPPESKVLKEAKDNATALITSAMGGYVYKTTSELYIMDTNDPKTAKKVWRWNLNGLGYSSSGIDGPYGLAMTMDGSIVADFITTGVLSAELIKTGMLKDVLNKSYWNMKTGEIHVTGTFSQTTASGVKSLDIENNQVKFYAWNDDGNYVGSIGAVKDTSTDRVGVNMWCDQGDTLALGCKESDGNIYPVFKVDSNTYKDKTPYIRNGANGTMFQGCGDGVTIENGLIKKWNLPTVSGTPSFISGLSWTDGKITSVTRTTLSVSNGLITGWSSEKTDY